MTVGRVQRHKDRVEGVLADRADQWGRIVMARDAQEAHATLRARLLERLDGAVFPEDAIQLVVGTHVMELPEVEAIRL